MILAAAITAGPAAAQVTSMVSANPAPKGSNKDLDKIVELLGYGLSMRKIARFLGYGNHASLSYYVKSRQLQSEVDRRRPKKA